MNKLSKSNRIDKWVNAYKINQIQFDYIYKFALDNIELYRIFNEMTIKNLIKPYHYVSEIIYFTFLDCINAAGGNKLTTTAQSCENLHKILKMIEKKEKIDFTEFMGLFDKNIHEINEFFKYLVGVNNKNEQIFPNFREKKASLFLRELFYADRERNIFRNYNYQDFRYSIALDVVIENLFNLILKFDYNSNDKIKSETGKDFYNFNEYIEIIKKDKEVIDSFWFWGYFNTSNKDNGETIKNNFRKVAFNEAKYFTNKFFYPSEDNIYYFKLKNFSDLFKDKLTI